MRFMMLMIPKGYENAAPGAMPDAKAVEAMMKYNEELQKAGVLIALDGLHPPSAGARVTFPGGPGGKPLVTDGPFPEVKEVLGGYWMINVKSKQEAIDWAKRCPGSSNETIEIRRVQEMEDFPADVKQAAAGFDEMQKNAAAPKPTRSMFVNLPVRDLKISMAFFKALGFSFNQQFTDDNAACLVLGDNLFSMLLTESYFKTFTHKAIADTKSTAECCTAFTVESKAEVNRIVEAALKAGGKKCGEPKDHGFMYQWGFEDPDGHTWEPFWMDPAFLQQPQAAA
jgi:predicted lactoylglutathione lyase